MLISYNHKFIFFHVAKAAGLSIREALKDYVQEPEKFKIKRPPKYVEGKLNNLYVMWDSALTHATAKQTRKEIDPVMYDSFYKFAFVRNPWDLQVSMYHFILKETDHIYYSKVKSMSNFEEYLIWMMSTKRPFAKGATKFQKEMLTDDNGELIVDFVGRFENLARDFNYVCQILSIQASMPYLNQSKHKDYRAYYNDTTKQIVSEYFKDDIELFGYTFDGYKPELERIERRKSFADKI